MKYLLDTNICVLLIRRKSPRVLARLAAVPVADVGVSAITVAELRYGAERSGQPARNHGAVNAFLLPLTIIRFDQAAADHYGRIRADLAMRGLLVGPLDTLIASQAASRSLTMVTNNVREFRRIPGLAVEDWTRRSP